MPLTVSVTAITKTPQNYFCQKQNTASDDAISITTAKVLSFAGSSDEERSSLKTTHTGACGKELYRKITAASRTDVSTSVLLITNYSLNFASQ